MYVERRKMELDAARMNFDRVQSSRELCEKSGKSKFRRVIYHARRLAADVRRHKCVEFLTCSLLVLYSLVIFGQIVLRDSDNNPKSQDAHESCKRIFFMNFVDLGLLIVLSMELVLYGLAEGCGSWVMFDGFVFTISLALAIPFLVLHSCGDDSFGLSTWHLREIFRILRLLVVFRRLMEAYEKNKSGATIAWVARTPLERTVNLLKNLNSRPALPVSLRDEIESVISIVAGGGLYESLSVPPQRITDGSNEANAWVTLAQPTEPLSKPLTRRSCGHLSLPVSLQPPDKSGGGTLVAPARRRISRVSGSSKRGSESTEAFRMFVGSGGQDLQSYLDEHFLSWSSFDVFKLDHLSNHNPLVSVGLHVMKSMEDLLQLDARLRIASYEYGRFLQRLQGGYRKTIPFHNAIHAADVGQAMMWLCVGPALMLDQIFPEGTEVNPGVPSYSATLLGCLVASLGHDVEHTGLNNAYHVKRGTGLALRYSDSSVLERHHCAALFSLLAQPVSDCLKFVDMSTKNEIRRLIIDLILATDPSKHFVEMGRLRAKREALESLRRRSCRDSRDPRSPAHDSQPSLRFSTSASDVPIAAQLCEPLLLLQQMLHGADISNPGRPLLTSLVWTERCMAEFFSQGDQEKSQGLPLSGNMDRLSTNIARCQQGFQDYLVREVFVELSIFSLGGQEGALQEVMSHLDTNYAYWERVSDKMEEEMKSGRQSIPFPSQPSFGRLARGVRPFLRSLLDLGHSPLTQETDRSISRELGWDGAVQA